jgi:hypothetical protein
MSKLKKIILALIAIPILLIVALLIGVVLFANTAAKRGIEAGATYALGVDTSLQSASVGLFSGKFGLSGLKVANVKGYKADKFMSLGDGNVAVSLGSLTKDTIEIPTFNLDTIEVNLEKKDGKANYQEIMDHLSGLSKGTQPSNKPADQGGGKKLIVRDLTIKHVVVNADLVGGPIGTVKIPIDEIKLKDVGKGTGKGVADSGVTVGQLSSIIVQAVLAAAVENGGNLLPADMVGDLKGQLAKLDGLKDVGVQVVGKAGEAAQQLGKNLQGAAEEGTKQLQKVGEGIGDQLKGILPGGKK